MVAKRHPLQILRLQKPARKFLASIFSVEDVISQTINAEYYLFLLVQLTNILKKNSTRISSGESYLVPQCLAHRAISKQNKLAYLCFQYHDHPPYSTYLDPLDYHLFPGMNITKEISPFFLRHVVLLLPLSPCSRDKSLNIFEWLVKLEQRANSVLSFEGGMLKNQSLVDVVGFLPGRCKD